ncbi:MAG: cysteine hydrolase [Armatimonadetes bacterium]|nr:cysteine hydrolase [Armatimonadota bacterium]
MFKKTNDFLNYLKNWKKNLKPLRLEKILKETTPENTALFCVDLINGFCRQGPLASPRIAKIIKPIVKLIKKAYILGIKNLVFIQDAHPPDSPEFKDFGPHCQAGSSEAEMVSELKNLPFSNEFTVIPKYSINSFIGTDLEKYLLAHPQLEKIICLGDCTDLCLYQLAMHFKSKANSEKLKYQVIVPENCVETYDLSLKTAQKLKLIPHPGDFFHLVFLYHLNLNGVKILR